MDAAATPDLVVRYLRELSADLVAAAVVDADGTTVAGPDALGVAARDAAAAGTTAVLEVRDEAHLVVVVRGDAHVIAAVHTRHALAGLVRHDLLTALGDLGDRAVPGADAGPATTPAPVPASVAARLLSAARSLRAAHPDLSGTRHQRPK